MHTTQNHSCSPFVNLSAIPFAPYPPPVQPLGLEIFEVKADGHCLYRSLEDQLALSAQLPLKLPLVMLILHFLMHNRCVRCQCKGICLDLPRSLCEDCEFCRLRFAF
jgi:hypothetical protein